MRQPYTINTYTRFAKWAALFAKGEVPGLIVLGTAGLGKSYLFRQHLAGKFSVEIKGKLSAFDLYCQLWENRGALFFADDTRQILRNGECVNLLMQLAEHEKQKPVQWNTAMTFTRSEDDAEDDRLPKRFMTTSSIALLLNRMDADDEDLEPVASRSTLLKFVPSKEEVHRFVGTWFPQRSTKHRAIYDFIGRSLRLIPVPDIRDYTGTVPIYSMNWRDVLVERWTKDPYMSAAVAVANDTKLTTRQTKAALFKELCGGSPAQMYKLLAKLTPLQNCA